MDSKTNDICLANTLPAAYLVYNHLRPRPMVILLVLFYRMVIHFLSSFHSLSNVQMFFCWHFVCIPKLLSNKKVIFYAVNYMSWQQSIPI
jgi:hypothetical protein